MTEEEEITRLKKSFQTACANIAALNDQRQALTAALDTATLLLDQLLTEMRLANVTPSQGIIFTKAAYDQAMQKLLRRARTGPPVPENGDFEPHEPA